MERMMLPRSTSRLHLRSPVILPNGAFLSSAFAPVNARFTRDRNNQLFRNRSVLGWLFMSVLSFRNIFIGVIATFTMDVLTALTIKLRLTAPLSPHLIGRWFWGKVLHSDIGLIAPVRHELVIAVTVHYLIGITLALAYLFTISALGLSPRNPTASLGSACARICSRGCSCFRRWATGGSARKVHLEHDYS
jgi:hypothetical protein